MRATLLFLMIVGATFVSPAGRATTNDQAKPSEQAKPTTREVGRVAKAEKRLHPSVPLPKPASPHRATNTPKPSLTGKTVNSRRQVSKQPNGPTNASLLASPAAANTRSVQRPTVSRPAVSTPNDLRHHGANPASIGGPRNTTVSSTAVLNGRAVSRKP